MAERSVREKDRAKQVLQVCAVIKAILREIEVIFDGEVVQLRTSLRRLRMHGDDIVLLVSKLEERLRVSIPKGAPSHWRTVRDIANSCVT